MNTADMAVNAAGKNGELTQSSTEDISAVNSECKSTSISYNNEDLDIDKVKSAKISTSPPTAETPHESVHVRPTRRAAPRKKRKVVSKKANKTVEQSTPISKSDEHSVDADDKGPEDPSVGNPEIIPVDCHEISSRERFDGENISIDNKVTADEVQDNTNGADTLDQNSSDDNALDSNTTFSEAQIKDSSLRNLDVETESESCKSGFSQNLTTDNNKFDPEGNGDNYSAAEEGSDEKSSEESNASEDGESTVFPIRDEMVDSVGLSLGEPLIPDEDLGAILNEKKEYINLPETQKTEESKQLLEENSNLTNESQQKSPPNQISPIEEITKVLQQEKDKLKSHPNSNKKDVCSIYLMNEDAAFVLGKRGTTKRKVARVSGTSLHLEDCISQPDGKKCLKLDIRGTTAQREQALLYIQLILRQRIGNIIVTFDINREDLSIVNIPHSAVGYITGPMGSVLRRVEDIWGTLMFFVANKEWKNKHLANRRKQLNVEKPKTLLEEPQESKSSSKDHKTDKDSDAVGTQGEEHSKEEKTSADEDHAKEPHDSNDNSTVKAEVVDDDKMETVNRVNNLPQRGIAASLAQIFEVATDSEKTKSDKLLIFGTSRNRCGAELKVMSAVEQKIPGYFGSMKPYQCNLDGFGIDVVEIPHEAFSYALGKEGRTRRKLARASGCILEYIGKCACVAGNRKERARCKDFLGWLIEQRQHPSYVNYTERDDCTVVNVPANMIAIITGRQGVGLRDLEEKTGTFCFFGAEREGNASPEKLLIFSYSSQCRNAALRSILDKISQRNKVRRPPNQLQQPINNGSQNRNMYKQKDVRKEAGPNMRTTSEDRKQQSNRQRHSRNVPNRYNERRRNTNNGLVEDTPKPVRDGDRYNNAWEQSEKSSPNPDYQREYRSHAPKEVSYVNYRPEHYEEMISHDSYASFRNPGDGYPDQGWHRQQNRYQRPESRSYRNTHSPYDRENDSYIHSRKAVSRYDYEHPQNFTYPPQRLPTSSYSKSLSYTPYDDDSPAHSRKNTDYYNGRYDTPINDRQYEVLPNYTSSSHLPPKGIRPEMSKYADYCGPANSNYGVWESSDEYYRGYESKYSEPMNYAAHGYNSFKTRAPRMKPHVIPTPHSTDRDYTSPGYNVPPWKFD